MDNKELLRRRRLARIQKSIDFSDLTAGGKLSAEDADQFITYIIDEGPAFFGTIQTIRMTRDTRHIDVLSIPQRQMRKKDPGIDPQNLANIALSRNTLSAVKVMFQTEIEEEVYEENIEKEGFDDTLMKQIAIAVSNDALDLGINGDEASGDPFININDGWMGLAKAKTTAIDATSVSKYKDLWLTMILALPRWFKTNKSALRIYVSPNIEARFRAELDVRDTALGDAYLDKDRRAHFQGVLIEPLGVMVDSEALLTYPKNLVFGLEYAMSVERDKDIFRGVHQVAVTLKMDFEVEVDSALVIAENIPTL